MKVFMFSTVLLLDGDGSSTSFIPIWIAVFLCIILPMIMRRNENAAVRVIEKRKTKEEKTKMTELARTFIEKECIIYLFNGNQYTGTVKEVTDGAMLVDNNGIREAINLDFVARIREYPKKKNGKKKSIVLD